ncbi:MAG TPA: type II secretion system protein GspC [Geobacteraceae bacterium]|nr:type II secretion system protein GspC [Geobacteraceae bacterium]
MNRCLPSINVALAVMIIALLALIASDVTSYRLGHLFTKQSARQASPPPTATIPEDLSSYGQILEKGLFGKATQGKLVPLTPQSIQSKAQPAFAQGDFTLLGTVIGSFRETYALIQKNSSKEERVFRLGDTVFGSGTLASVAKESVEILAGGSKVRIMTPTAAGGQARPPAATTVGGPAQGMAAQVGAGSFIVDQRALNASLDNISQTMTDARLLPSMKDGKVEGFRVSEVKPQGIFGTIGIKNGDILLRINEFPIDSPEKAIQSFASLKGQNRIRLDLVRDGQPTTFNYDIR